MDNNKQFTNHVVISLKDFMEMTGEIEKLKYEKNYLERKCDNLKQFVEDVRLPADIIADGRVLHSKSEIMRNPMDMEVTYTVKVTVFEEDVKRYGYES